ncbi:MAG: response regulator [Betaproteobacteria bacterium]|nr:response regulator [Betaproteobacteria bacterium]
MVHSTRIALLGFGRLEHAAFEAFFRVAARRCPAYAREDDFRAADFVIVDGADAAACAAVRDAGLAARAVVLGRPALAGALLQLARPLNLIQVVQALDAVLAARHKAEHDTVREGLVVADPDEEAETASDAAHAEPEAVSSLWLSLPDDPPPAPRPPLPAPTPAAAPTVAERRRRPRGAALEHILVVDDSDIALRFMATHLQRFGFQIHLAKSGEEALVRVAERRFEFVFLDVRMEGIDGFQACKAIKRADYPPGQTPPTVVIITSLRSPADRLRGTMAGADAYLTKPLRERELLKIVGEREVTRHAYAETVAASTRR